MILSKPLMKDVLIDPSNSNILIPIQNITLKQQYWASHRAGHFIRSRIIKIRYKQV